MTQVKEMLDEASDKAETIDVIRRLIKALLFAENTMRQFRAGNKEVPAYLNDHCAVYFTLCAEKLQEFGVINVTID